MRLVGRARKAPTLNEAGEPFDTAAIGFDKPAHWVPWVKSNTLDDPIVLFAPQADPAAAPTTITIEAINVTDDVTEILGPDGSSSVATASVRRRAIRGAVRVCRLDPNRSSSVATANLPGANTNPPESSASTAITSP